MKEILVQTETVLGYVVKLGLAQCGPNSLQALTKLEDVAFCGYGEDLYTLKMIDTVGFILGALSPTDGSLAAAIEVVPMWGTSCGKKQAFVHGVLVHPEHQNHGLGSALIDLVTKKAFEEGYQSVVGTISPSNAASLTAFLNHNHFIGTTFIKDFYGPGEHRFWVQKDDSFCISHPVKQMEIAPDDFEALERLVGHGWIADGIVKKNTTFAIHLISYELS